MGFANVPYSRNFLVNGGFDFAQRVTPTAATAMSDDVYNHFDRWNSLIQGANATVTRIAGTDNTRYNGKMTAGGTTNRFGLQQICQAERSIYLRSKAVRFQIRLRPNKNAGSGTMNVRLAVVEWTGTANAVTSDIVNNWASSTFTTGNFFTSTTTTVVTTANFAVAHNVWTDAAVAGSVSSSCNNLMAFFWHQDVPANAADFLEFGKAGLYELGTPRVWQPEDWSADLLACRAHYNKTYSVDSPPGTASGSGARYFEANTTAILAGNGGFGVPMYAVPTVTIISPSGTNNKVQPVAGGADVGTNVAAGQISQDGFYEIGEASPFTAGTRYRAHFTAVAEL